MDQVGKVKYSKKTEKLDRIIMLLEQLINSHPCRRCKALGANGGILCVNCGQTNP